MWNIKLSKEFAIIVAVILGVWFLGPHILFSANEKTYESEIEEFEELMQKRQDRVAASIANLQVTDDNFLACIKAAAEERARIPPTNSGGIDNVRELKHLYCPRRRILSIKGIEAFERLEFLDISQNYIEDISPLAMNTALKSLRLDKNPIEDINSLKLLVGLNDLSLPKLSHMTCDEVKQIIGEVKSNLSHTSCTSAEVIENKKEDYFEKELKKLHDEETYKLNHRQEEELLDYEFETQRRFD